MLDANGNLECVDWSKVGRSGLYGAALSGLGPTGFLFGRGGSTASKFGYKFQGLANRGHRRFGWSHHRGRNWLSYRNGKKHTDILPGPSGPARAGRDGAVAGAAGALLTPYGCGCN